LRSSIAEEVDMRSLQTIVRKHRTSVLGVEQRLHPRHAASPETQGWIRTSVGDCSCAAKVRDLSAAGASLIVCDPFRPGELLRIEFSRSDPDFACTLLLRVVHCSERADGEFVIGGQFVGELEPAELNALIN
jgi:hypothetical protein